jgi:hypothetical protein
VLALRIALPVIGPTASGKCWGGRAVSTLGSNRCNSTSLRQCCRMSPTAWENDRGTIGAIGCHNGLGTLGVPRAVSFYGLLGGPPSGPPEKSSISPTSLAGSARPYSLTTDRSARVDVGYYRACGSGHSRLANRVAMRAYFRV